MDQPAAPSPISPTKRLQPVAPWLHTVFVLVVVIGFSIGGGEGHQKQFVDRHGRLPLYFVSMGFEWVLALFVIWSARRKGVSLGELVRGKWNNFGDVLLDAAIAAGFWITWILFVVVLSAIALGSGLLHAHGLQDTQRVIGFLAPHTPAELAAWVLLCVTAGFCEEILFRGLIQRQAAALTQSATLGVIIQGVVFGAAHGYQGLARMVLIGIFGVFFGILAAWRKSLRPGMMAHSWQDWVSGSTLYVLNKVMH